MVLYSANLLGEPVPVKKTKTKKVEKEQVLEQTPPPSDTAEEVKDVKEKKPRTEKQIAALEKMKAAREAKKAAKLLEESEKLRMETDAKEREEAAIKAKEEKKLRAAEKRKLKKMEKNVDVAVDEAVAEQTAEPVLKKKRVAKKVDNTPPEWFQQYIKGVKTEHNSVAAEPKPTEIVEKESVKEAKVHWNNSFTRARVTNEVDNHMDKMYQMMFGRKL
jgi:hypothetical protein